MQSYRPLKVPAAVADEVTPNEFKTMKENDDTLARVIDLARQQVQRITKCGAIAQFMYRNRILCREYRSVQSDSKTSVQIVVPKKL